MENRGGQDDKVSKRVWKVVEASAREVGMGETKGRRGRKRSREKERKKKQKKGKTVEVRKVAEEWEIWDEEEEAAKLEEKAKKLILERFHKWIKVFRKKQSENMPTRKLWDHEIDVKEEFML